MIILYWYGTKIELQFSFFATAAVIGLLEGERMFLQLFSACLLHELGHVMCMYLLHRRIQCISFCGLGITIRPVQSYSTYWKDILIQLAGPVCNLCCGVVLFTLHGMHTFAIIHLGLGLFNLLPYIQLDGGSVLQALLFSNNLLPDQVNRISNIISFICTIFIAILAICFRIHNLSLYCVLIYLLLMQLILKHN